MGDRGRAVPESKARRAVDGGRGWAVAEGIENAADDEPDDEHEVVEVEILNHEQDEVVGTVNTDGNLDTESEVLRNVSLKHRLNGINDRVKIDSQNTLIVDRCNLVRESSIRS